MRLKSQVSDPSEEDLPKLLICKWRQLRGVWTSTLGQGDRSDPHSRQTSSSHFSQPGPQEPHTRPGFPTLHTDKPPSPCCPHQSVGEVFQSAEEESSNVLTGDKSLAGEVPGVAQSVEGPVLGFSSSVSKTFFPLSLVDFFHWTQCIHRELLSTDSLKRAK